MNKVVSTSLCYWGKKTGAEGLSRQKDFFVMVLTVDLPLAGNCGREFLFALLCLTLHLTIQLYQVLIFQKLGEYSL